MPTAKPPARQSGLVAFGSFAARPGPTPTTIPEDSSFRKLFTERRAGECRWICDERDLAEMCCPSPIGNARAGASTIMRVWRSSPR